MAKVVPVQAEELPDGWGKDVDSTSSALGTRYSKWQPLQAAAPPAGETEYDRTVDELASRGFTLGALLEFLCLLLERNVMPSFDPDSSSTEQVAFGAAVPSSEHGPYARVMTCGQPCYPKCLITHTWGNVFCHTLAAAVADTMGKRYFFHLIPRLRTVKRVRSLMDEIASMSGNRLIEKTYWFCALSINQHRVGCHNQHNCENGHLLKFSGMVGSACQLCTGASCLRPMGTGDIHFKCQACEITLCKECKANAVPVCGCDVDKVPAGSDLCEVDKFDQMMVRLQSVHTDFYQVVALDKTGSALTRTWVVAEIAQAQRDRLVQKIQPFFPLGLSSRSIATRILNIDVRESQASNPADTEMILAKIADKDKYNEEVRQVLLQHTRPSSFHMFVLGAVALFGIVYLIVVTAFTASQSGSEQCERHNCSSRYVFALPILFAIVLIISHVEYGAISKDIRASSGLRCVALHEADSASSTKWYHILWRLQRWYVRQSAQWDTVDNEVSPDESELAKISMCTWFGDFCALIVLRLFIFLWLGVSIATGVDGKTGDASAFLELVFAFPVVAILTYYDPAVRALSAEGLTFLALLVSVCLIGLLANTSDHLLKLLAVPVLVLPCVLCGLCLCRAPCCCGRCGVGGGANANSVPREQTHIVGHAVGLQSTVRVQIPDGVVPGSLMNVPTPSGTSIQVAVPAGAPAGSVISVQVLAR